MQMDGTGTRAGEDGEVYLESKRLHGAGQHWWSSGSCGRCASEHELLCGISAALWLKDQLASVSWVFLNAVQPLHFQATWRWRDIHLRHGKKTCGKGHQILFILQDIQYVLRYCIEVLRVKYIYIFKKKTFSKAFILTANVLKKIHKHGS